MFEPDLLKNKTIIITRGGTGLGKSMTRRFGELGTNLVITSGKMDMLEKTANEIRKTGPPVLPVQCDIGDFDQVGEMIHKTVTEFGSIDVLVNNAAGNFICPTERLTT